MLVEFERLWLAGGTWIFTFAYWFWIYEDSRRHNARAWPWIVLMLLGVPITLYISTPNNIVYIHDPVSLYISTYYDWYVLPSRGVEWYRIPRFTYDVSHLVEPLWVLDFYVLWGAVISVISTTLSVYVTYWIYRDCQKSGMRATPWIFLMNFLPGPWPLSIFLPFGGFMGQIAVLCGYLLHKYGYI